ncbi:nad dependent epimerase dehydratase family protein [Ophiostoma piceae UAMH 11346]|uniref:Nad dependent epimerase dehydratase family protein n=1 Tax=Ophiostoma piceae (strain UAMH 11346) TaxID=1262450 RepID=S3CQS1_OPHP1|nr:nad dependent epimerase dehydratase family protein [Ophiostoma piceae UAMH 11346]
MPSQLLLITGATGFIGTETVYQAVNKGYRTRLAIRRPEQADALKQRFPGHEGQLEFALVPQIDNKDALATALEGVDFIVHVASPMPLNDDDLRTAYIDPAVRGTLAILEAAKGTPSVKRVIITSSILALAPLSLAARPGFAVEEGANASIEVDLDAPIPPAPKGPMYKYHISKILAHRATIEWAAKHKPAFDVATVHPYYVVGYDRTQKPGVAVEAPAPVNSLYLHSLKSGGDALQSSFVDVRDVAAIHIGAITVASDKLKARGEVTEYIANGPFVMWDELRAFVAKKYPGFPLKHVAAGVSQKPPISSTERASRDLGVVFHDPLDTLAALLDQHSV